MTEQDESRPTLSRFAAQGSDGAPFLPPSLLPTTTTTNSVSATSLDLAPTPDDPLRPPRRRLFFRNLTGLASSPAISNFPDSPYFSQPFSSNSRAPGTGTAYNDRPISRTGSAGSLEHPSSHRKTKLLSELDEEITKTEDDLKKVLQKLVVAREELEAIEGKKREVESMRVVVQGQLGRKPESERRVVDRGTIGQKEDFRIEEGFGQYLRVARDAIRKLFVLLTSAWSVVAALLVTPFLLVIGWVFSVIVILGVAFTTIVALPGVAIGFVGGAVGVYFREN